MSTFKSTTTNELAQAIYGEVQSGLNIESSIRDAMQNEDSHAWLVSAWDDIESDYKEMINEYPKVKGMSADDKKEIDKKRRNTAQGKAMAKIRQRFNRIGVDLYGKGVTVKDSKLVLVDGREKAKDRFSELAAKLKNKSITLNEYAEFMDLVRDMAPQS